MGYRKENQKVFWITRHVMIQILFVIMTFFLIACSIMQFRTQGDYPSLKLAGIFSDNMVLQQGIEVPVWGWTKPGRRITVTLLDKTASVKADKSGAWIVRIGPFSAGGPYELTVIGKETIIFKNVMIGEVWFASGQSNMEWPVAWSEKAEIQIPAATWPDIRLCTIPKNMSETPVDDIETSGWTPCTPETVPMFSAVAYFFARDLHTRINVPVGIINCSWGGSTMEAWTSLEALEGDQVFSEVLAERDRWIAGAHDPLLMKQYKESLAIWKEQTGGALYHKDPGDTKLDEGWASPDFIADDWATMSLPGYWEEQNLPGVDGVVWFRKTVTIPEEWSGKDLLLSLGIIDDTDETYFNGVKVGSVGLETELFWNTPRVYSVPGTLVKAGENVIAVRVFDHYISGGFGGPEQSMYIALKEDAVKKISLKGNWRNKVSVVLQQMPMKPGENGQQVPTLLFNGMLHPILPFGIKGVIWYQGESNALRYKQYRRLSELMITDWRQRWGVGDFPLLYVQLAGINLKNFEYIREAQLKTLEVPNTAMVVALDVGDETDIHPRDKQTVGNRLALAATSFVYGNKDVIYTGPVYKSMKIEGDKIRLFFEESKAGPASKKGTILRGFTIAGADKKFIPAYAKIEWDTVIVWHPDVPEPVAVRYGWNTYPYNDLCNVLDFPASPFKTDDFEE